MRFRTLSAALLAAIIATLCSLVTATPALAAGKSCSLKEHTPKYRVTSMYKKARITHASNYTMPVGWKVKTTEISRKRTRISVGGTYQGEVNAEAGIPLRLIKAKVDAHFNVSVSGRYTRTTGESVKVSTTYTNPGPGDRSYVFYRGYFTFHGTFAKSICVKRAGDTNPYSTFGVVQWREGTWRTYDPGFSKGAVGCGGSSTNLDPVARAAKNSRC